MNFGNLMDSAKNAASQLGGSNDNKPADSSTSNPIPNPTDNSNASAQQKWNDVGSSAKAAVGDYQARQARGENPDYKELGNVAQKAAAAYNTEGGPKDAAGIGKMMAGGLFGGKKEGEGQQQQPQQGQEGQQQPPQQ